jgi:hypothetical protein
VVAGGERFQLRAQRLRARVDGSVAHVSSIPRRDPDGSQPIHRFAAAILSRLTAAPGIVFS